MSPRRRTATAAPRRRVALMVESSLNSGRLMLRGIAEYVRRAGSWSIYHEPSHFHNVLPDWIRDWRGEGIIARVRNRAVAKQYLKRGLPLVDILGDVAETGIPLVQVDNRAIAELAANHLLDHGFRAFAYCGIRSPLWSLRRHEVFHEEARSVTRFS